MCPTKLLWTRVRFSIVNTLRETTLADLLASPTLPAEGAIPHGTDPADRGRGSRSRRHTNHTTLTTGA